ncbi:hypothetical protein CASFOL_006473 [Castilleja foliolosa]|uniref:Uncharacterized protein n=1 Tax=Castilleja foliolosa TaxID=1961234 RepID=A0ABD3E6G3_9LAMI
MVEKRGAHTPSICTDSSIDGRSTALSPPIIEEHPKKAPSCGGPGAVKKEVKEQSKEEDLVPGDPMDIDSPAPALSQYWLQKAYNIMEGCEIVNSYTTREHLIPHSLNLLMGFTEFDHTNQITRIMPNPNGI